MSICPYLYICQTPTNNHTQLLTPVFALFALLNAGLPHLASSLLTNHIRQPPTAQQYQLIKSFSLLLLGMFLSSLATLNFSLSFVIGLLSTPLSFTRPWPASAAARCAHAAALHLLSPFVVLAAGSALGAVPLARVLEEAAFGWHVWGLYTPLIVWCVWWPAWLVGQVVVLGQPAVAGKEKKA